MIVEIDLLNIIVLVVLRALIKMGFAVVTVKIMPASPDINLEDLEKKAKVEIVKFAGEGETKVKEESIGFGLKTLKIFFVMDESKGSPDPVAEEISELEGVSSAEITDVRRALG